MEKWSSENWWVSKYNYLDEYRSTLNLPKKVKVHDATLRDGEQTPGVVFTVDDKVEIAKMLDEIGVDRIEAGMPAVSKADEEAIKKIVGLGLKAEIFSFARAIKEDIDMAVECGVDGVVIEIPTGRPKLKYQFSKWTDEDIIEKSIETIKYAKANNLKVVYFGYDTTRADYEFLVELYSKIIEEARPDSIGIVDTMGCILPGAVNALVRKLKAQFDIPIEIHAHNDFGMGVATSFAAVEGGAEVIHTSINGMGERSGNTQLEAILVGLKVLYGLDVDYKLNILKEVSDKVEEISNFRKNVNLPLVGDNIFVRESGIGIDLVMNTPLAMFALRPEFIGNKAGVILGKKSGLKSIDVKLEELGLTIDESIKPKLLERIKSLAINNKRAINDEEFKQIISDLEKENI